MTVITIRYGTHDLYSSQYPDIVVNPANVHIHSLYDSSTYANNIAVVNLPYPIGQNSYIQYITPRTTDLNGGTNVQIFGWGLTSGTPTGSPSNVLLKGSVLSWMASHAFRKSKLIMFSVEIRHRQVNRPAL